MSSTTFFDVLTQEIARIDAAHVSKRNETVIEGFTDDPAPRALIAGQPYRIFNSNDYLGLRHHPAVKAGEAAAAEQFGAGPGAVRFISGSLKIHRDLEAALAKFHGREAAMVFSSAFATNLAVLFCLIKGQSADSLVTSKVIVISDELNHRSIIDGIRLPGLAKDQKAIFKHMDADDLRQVLEANLASHDRALVVTDGVFSMLGEFQDLAKIRAVIDEYDKKYSQGVLLVVDDCHGVAACGQTGRGVEEITGARADVLVGTLGKGFGADGGYVVADQVVIDYLRESAATYIYSNSISPGTAGAALAAVELLDLPEGQDLLDQSRQNVDRFKAQMTQVGFKFAADSSHPIQPLLIGDTAKTKQLKVALLEAGFLVTNINYPVVPKGRDEIRVQICATHTAEDLDVFVDACAQAAREIGLLAE